MKSGPRILLAGCGRWGKNVLRDLLVWHCRVVVCDPAAEARRYALSVGAEAAVDCLDDAAGVDGAIVATPTLAHEAAVRALLDRQIPVFCEKPLTSDSASARDLSRIGGGRLFVMEKWRYHPAIEFLGDLARSEALGRIRRLTTSRLQPKIEGYDVDPIWVLAPHEISIGREIFGRLPSPLLASGKIQSAGEGWLEAHFGGEVDWRFRVSSEAPRRIRFVEATFDAATCAWSLDDEFAIRILRGATEERVLLKSAAPLGLEIGAFVAYLNGGAPPRSTAPEGAETVELVDRLREMAGI